MIRRIAAICIVSLALPSAVMAEAVDVPPSYPWTMNPFAGEQTHGSGEHLSVVDDSESIFKPEGLHIRLVPEPGSLALLGVGAAVIFWRRRGP